MRSRELWEFKYAPQSFDELILNKELRPQLEKALHERPNMLLYGPPGGGKGSFVNAMINHHDIKSNTMKINASAEGGIDTIREKVKDFAQSYALDGELKLVYLNEADHPNLQAAQKSLRQLIEDTHKNAQFVLACNYVQVIIPELISRLRNFNISGPPAEEIFAYCKKILDAEKVKYHKKTIIDIIKRVYPDIRSTIVTLQSNVLKGELPKSISVIPTEEMFEDILKGILKGNPEEVRAILKSNAIHYTSLYSWLYNKLMDAKEEITKNDIQAMFLVCEHSFRNETATLKEVNFMHMIFKMIREGIV